MLQQCDYWKICWAISRAKKDRICMQDASNCLWFNILDKTPVGVLCIMKYRPACWKLRCLFIDFPHRNKGIGSKVLNQVVEIAKEQGIKKMECATFKVDWFEKRGWENISSDMNSRFKMGIEL